MKENGSENEREEMNRREITLPDGRYMIFYTFGDDELKKENNDPREDV